MLILQNPKEQQLPLLESAVHNYGKELATWLPWFQQLENQRLLRAWLQERCALHRGGQEYHAFVFWQNDLAGMLSLSRHDRHNRKAQFSYWLLPSYRQLGLVQKAAPEVFTIAFHKWQLQRLGVEMASPNSSSRRTAERLGFQKEGLERKGIRLHGKNYDLIKMGLLKEEIQNS